MTKTSAGETFATGIRVYPGTSSHPLYIRRIPVNKRRYAVFVLGVVLILWSDTGHPRDAQKEKPCTGAEARQFDFWLGDWSLTWKDKDGNELKGTNSITSILGGCVIQEQFNDPGSGFRGMSVSTYSSTTGKWQQTWVDNTGSYLDFVGEFTDGKMALQRTATGGGKQFLQRMMWYNISPDKLDWNWERSDDDGASWKLLWKIHYTRSK